MSIEAMKMALEALDCLIYDKPYAGRFADALIGLRTAIQQAEAEQPATTEPDEWKLVPIVPTEKMLLAYTGGAVTNSGFRWCRHQWSVMLAAAPAAPAAPAARPAPSVPADVVRDAGRYRFILAAADDMTTSRYKSLCELLGVAITEDFDLDAAIDAAMLAAK